VTPSTRPVTRLSSAYVRDRGMRAIVVTITGSLIELRAKGLRSRETVDIASLYTQAVRHRVLREKAERKAARKAGKPALRRVA
jgi:hypothetical protein